jgi:hypothetical protein
VSDSPPVAEIVYQPEGRQLSLFHASDARVRVIIGPLGSGKTTAAIIEVLNIIDTQPPDKYGVRRSRGVITRNTTVDLKASTIKDWTSIVPPQFGVPVYSSPIEHVIKYQHADGVTRVEAEVLFLGFDNPKDVRKIRGMQLTWMLSDETKEQPKSIIDMLLARLGRYPRVSEVPNAKYRAVMITNAPDSDHWIAQSSSAPPPGWEFFIQPGGVVRDGEGRWTTNPQAENLRNLPADYYQQACVNKSDEWIRSNLGNEFVMYADGRPVHPDFSSVIHVARHRLEVLPGVPIQLGYDFGRTPAAALVQYDAALGQWRVFDEFCTTNTGAAVFAEELLAYLGRTYPGHPVSDDSYGDPSGSSMAQTRDETCIGILQDAGLPCWPAPSNDFDLRTAALDTLLRKLQAGRPGIIISPACRMLVRGLTGAYQFRRLQVLGRDQYSDVVDKSPESHVVEALHYVLLGSSDTSVGEAAVPVTGARASEFHKVEQDYGGWHPDQRRVGV